MIMVMNLILMTMLLAQILVYVHFFFFCACLVLLVLNLYLYKMLIEIDGTTTPHEYPLKTRSRNFQFFEKKNEIPTFIAIFRSSMKNALQLVQTSL